LGLHYPFVGFPPPIPFKGGQVLLGSGSMIANIAAQ